jgi:hypothetical protein
MSKVQFHNPENVPSDKLPKGHRFLTDQERRDIEFGLRKEDHSESQRLKPLIWERSEGCFSSTAFYGNSVTSTYATSAPLAESEARKTIVEELDAELDKLENLSEVVEDAANRIEELEAELKTEQEKHKKATDLVAELKRSLAFERAAHEQTEADLARALERNRAMQSNASGNAVLVRSDGFSKPISLYCPPFDSGWDSLPYRFEQPVLVPGSSFKDASGSTVAASRLETESYALTRDTDGFGRRIYRQVR